MGLKINENMKNMYMYVVYISCTGNLVYSMPGQEVDESENTGTVVIGKIC